MFGNATKAISYDIYVYVYIDRGDIVRRDEGDILRYDSVPCRNTTSVSHGAQNGYLVTQCVYSRKG